MPETKKRFNQTWQLLGSSAATAHQLHGETGNFKANRMGQFVRVGQTVARPFSLSAAAACRLRNVLNLLLPQPKHLLNFLWTWQINHAIIKWNRQNVNLSTFPISNSNKFT